MLVVISKKLKSLFLLLIGLLKRCFCCLRRRRYSDASLPLAVSSINGVSDNITSGENETGDWDAWDGPSSIVSEGGRWGSGQGDSKLNTVQQHIEEYRLNQKKKLTEPPPEEIEPDYFEDLAPTFTASKRQFVVLARPEEEQQVCSRPSATFSDTLLTSSDLLDWNEDERGWEEEAEEEADLNAALKEQRQKERQLRKQEQLRRKAEKDSMRLAQSKLATKLS